ncbi:hypothetical protein D3C77_352670 [compost metagenome]|uniref:hypothetical protein n=1 Tax=Pseudomonas TaxID=286 RepID=UPI000CFC0AEA|nr:hypothetical protein [Pseudomonas sp. MYb187]PRA62424.1 hypothetical protein CQ065_15480 [Pseudomonas sp. MYb187]
MKFDCAKITGKLDHVGSVSRMDGGFTASVKIDGAVIPKLKMASRLYEELNVGENVTLYGLFKNNKDKGKNEGILYGLKKESGEKMFSTEFRYKVPMLFAVVSVIAFCFVFVAGWALSVIPVNYFMGSSDFMYNTTVVAVVEASLAAAFFLWRAWVMVQATADPEAWKVMDAATVSSRFSKFDK